MRRTKGELIRQMKGGSGDRSESNVQSRVRLEAAARGIRLWRNNVGVLLDKDGRPIRFGLANDSSNVNEVLKSSDLVGWRKTLITPDMVGQWVAVTYMRECKPEGWVYTGAEREVAQKRWLDMVTADGGDAQFATGEGTFDPNRFNR